jgi:hypothetical protein
VAGQGMALSSDFVIRVAPGLSAKAAGVNPDVVANRGMILSLIVGGLALVIGYLMEVRKMRQPSPALLEDWESGDLVEELRRDTEVPHAPTIGHGPALRGSPQAVEAARHHPDAPRGGVGLAEHVETQVETQEEVVVQDAPATVSPKISTLFAILVPLAYAALIIYLIVGMTNAGAEGGVKGGDAAALVGGIAAITIFLGAFAESRSTFLERSAEHVVDGLVFAFKAMGVVLPIAGFFFIGNGDFSGDILGIPAAADGSPAGPAFLYDLVLRAQDVIPQNGYLTALGILAIGMIAGLEGSGFSGLPLTGSLSGSLAGVSGVSPETLAAIGQMGNIWSGGGTLVAWSSLIAVAGFARVNVLELARMCFVPVVVGLLVATFTAGAIFG